MYFDPEQNALVDPDGGVIPIELLSGSEQLPEHIQQQIRQSKSRGRGGPYLSLEGNQSIMTVNNASPLRNSRRSASYALGAESQLEAEMREMYASQSLGGTRAAESVVNGNVNGQTAEASHVSDWDLAKVLQSMEFEIAQDTRRGDTTDFDEKEYRASSCKRQLLTISTAICIIQVLFHAC